MGHFLRSPVPSHPPSLHKLIIQSVSPLVASVELVPQVPASFSPPATRYHLSSKEEVP